MASELKWVIRKADGQLLHSFAIDPRESRVEWFSPNASCQSPESKIGPLALSDEIRALSLLAALAANLPVEFLYAEVVSLTVN